jgi:hypothetical protein
VVDVSEKLSVMVPRVQWVLCTPIWLSLFVVLEILGYLIPPAALGPGIYSAYKGNEYQKQKNVSGSRARRCVGLTPLPPSMRRLSWQIGGSQHLRTIWPHGLLFWWIYFLLLYFMCVSFVFTCDMGDIHVCICITMGNTELPIAMPRFWRNKLSSSWKYVILRQICFVHWFRLALSEGRNRIGVSLLTWGRKHTHFPKHCVFYSLEHRTMDKIKKLSNIGCFTLL